MTTSTQVADGIFVISDMWTPEECQQCLREGTEPGFEEAAIGRGKHSMKMGHIRNNDRIIWDNPALANTLWEALADLVPQDYFGCQPIGLNERFRLYRYTVGQMFDWHADGSYRRPNGEESIYTLLLYLSDDFEGGETAFRHYTFLPKAGSVCLFQHKLEHKGNPVTSGTKYVLRSDVMYTKPKWKSGNA